MMLMFLFTALAFTFSVSASAAEKSYSIGTGNTRVYSNTALTNGCGWIYSSDEVTINQISSRYLKVTYPVARGTKTGYVDLKAFLTKTSGWTDSAARAKITTYRRPGGASYGYIANGDRVSVLGTNGNYVQLKYPVSGGYKYAFVKVSDYNSYIAPVKKPTITYSAHTEGIGWMPQVSEGKTAGTTGQSRRLEALRVKTTGTGIQVRAHVQNVGWQNWVSNNSVAGTTGRSLQMEAVQIRLTGTDASKFDIYYRAHVAGKSWLGWAMNGESAGTQGGSLRMEAIEIKVVAKGSPFSRGGAAFYNLTNQRSSNNTGNGFDPIWPCEKTYIVTCLYKYSSGAKHSSRFATGIDIGAPAGENVLAVEKGTVITSEYSTSSGFGNWIMIRHNNGKVSLYAHLNKRLVSAGTVVQKGTVIGKVGNTSAKYNIGPHLHFELGASNTSGAAGDPWKEYYKPKYGNRVSLVQAAAKYN